MTQFDQRNITMVMDLYEMTMAYGYFNDKDKDTKSYLMFFIVGILTRADSQYLRVWNRL